MTRIFRLAGAVRRDPDVEHWFVAENEMMRHIAQRWFELLRACGPDVAELLHDGQPTACVGDAAFAYVGAFTHHLNIGFFQGATLPDPAGLLIGTGKYMRHIKLFPDKPVNAPAIEALINAAYQDIVQRLA